jgi:lysyl-tRNA synthetase class 2
MDDTKSLIDQRKAKLAALRTKGIDPFKNKFTPTEKCAGARTNYAEGREVALAGRITAHRDMGKSMFIDIKDQSGRIQAYAQKNVLGDEQFDIFRHLDLGDFIGVRGTMFTTKTGEVSVKLSSFVILAKALRPPPAKWHGLEDTEIRYRQRYLDLLANDEVKQVFLKRSQIVAEIRNFLHTRGYVEVETPMMQAIPGGAAAQPFKTHHNALGCDFYLRIALELYHKRLLVGGVDKVFEIGRVFRNEGLSRKHNPEFTMLEAYQAYADYETMMELLEALISGLAKNILGTHIIPTASQLQEANTLLQELETLFQRAEQLINDMQDTPLENRETEKIGLEIAAAKKGGLRTVMNTGNCYATICDWLQFISKAQAAFNSDLQNSLPIKQTPRQQEISLINQQYGEIEQRLRKLTTKGEMINLEPPWQRVSYKKLIRQRIRDDWFEIEHEERLLVARDFGIEAAERPWEKAFKDVRVAKRYDEMSKAEKLQLVEQMKQHSQYLDTGVADFEVTTAMFEKMIEPSLIQPTFVTHLPKELVPLAKLSPDDPTTVEVFECCINGQEIAPGYTEQNDPIEQRERLEHQAGGEQQKLDEDFLVALEHGMPPAGGMGMGIDRLCMMLLGQESIRDVILFPQLKPK